jgi:hypothetical protein
MCSLYRHSDVHQPVPLPSWICLFMVAYLPFSPRELADEVLYDWCAFESDELLVELGPWWDEDDILTEFSVVDLDLDFLWVFDSIQDEPECVEECMSTARKRRVDCRVLACQPWPSLCSWFSCWCKESKKRVELVNRYGWKEA